jgi:4-aminobutyrate aminotransferase
MERWPVGAHGTTFGGNPVSCAAAMATIETIRDDNLLLRCRELGATAMARLNAMKERHPLIGDVRGVGLMIGIELVREDGSPDSTACGQLLEECLERGLILINCGPGKNIVRFIPPLTVTDAELDEALGIFAAALENKQMAGPETG